MELKVKGGEGAHCDSPTLSLPNHNALPACTSKAPITTQDVPPPPARAPPPTTY